MTEQPAAGTAERTAGGSQLAWVDDIEQLTLANSNFRTVVHTAGRIQLTVMRLGPGEEIGWESHPHLDQFLRIEQGEARLDLGSTGDAADETHHLGDDWAVIVPAGVWHNVTNTGQGELKLYSLYAPPEHPDGTVHVTKADADEHD
jgi:mannose-6-phosphate isomerase-like protein (cupin superfamily)